MIELTQFHLLRVKCDLTEVCEEFSEYETDLFLYSHFSGNLSLTRNCFITK